MKRELLTAEMDLSKIFFVLICLTLFSGCIKVERTLSINVDGSGRLTEHIQFDNRLVKTAEMRPEFKELLNLASEASATDRQKEFGDVKLMSCRVQARADGGKEVKAVYSFKDINKVMVPAFPNRSANWPQQKVSFKLDQGRDYKDIYGRIYTRKKLNIGLTPAAVALKDGPPTLSPKENERLRSMLPAFRAMIKGFHLKLSIEGFGLITTGRTLPVSLTKAVMKKNWTLYHLDETHFTDDDILLKTIYWNRFQDNFLGKAMNDSKTGNMGGGNILNHGLALYITVPETTLNNLTKVQHKK